MLGLKLETDPHWAALAAGNIADVLTDHAWCEQKAASNAISLMVSYPQHTELVKQLTEIAKEELLHFQMVHNKLVERNLKLGFERKDEYVNQLYSFIQRGKGKEAALVDRLLFSAMVEARSCERFRLLSETIEDTGLKEFYRELMVSEAGHYTVFLGFARKFGPSVELVNERWKEWLEYEAGVIRNYGVRHTIHG